jgi:hypothetical protein
VVQFSGDVSRVVYCKAWILGCCALQLMNFQSAQIDGPAASEGTQEIVRNLLEASEAPGQFMQGAVPGEPRLRGTLVSCLNSLASVGSINLGRTWREQKVFSPARCSDVVLEHHDVAGNHLWHLT